MTDPHPIPDSYWVEPGRLLAGEYPGARDPQDARQKLRVFLSAGVTLFVDLTRATEGLAPYEPLLLEEAARLGLPVRRLSRPICDMGVPSPAEMRQTLDIMDAALAAGETVYVHCWGGIGRTGTVVGCYLVRHGMTGQQALERVRRLRAGTPDGGRASPEFEVQRKMVLGWKPGQ